MPGKRSITETTYINKPEETMNVLASIRKLSVSLWLDDFGTGHSSLTHLQHFPLLRPRHRSVRLRVILSGLTAHALVKQR